MLMCFQCIISKFRRIKLYLFIKHLMNIYYIIDTELLIDTGIWKQIMYDTFKELTSSLNVQEISNRSEFCYGLSTLFFALHWSSENSFNLKSLSFLKQFVDHIKATTYNFGEITGKREFSEVEKWLWIYFILKQWVEIWIP